MGQFEIICLAIASLTRSSMDPRLSAERLPPFLVSNNRLALLHYNQLCAHLSTLCGRALLRLCDGVRVCTCLTARASVTQNVSLDRLRSMIMQYIK